MDDEWLLDEYDCWTLEIGHAKVRLMKRPPYCDRGHWLASVDGIPSIDHADSFPRYFMNLTRAKDELRDWLHWRLRQERGCGQF
jgi:hypothetical protein